MLIEPEMTSKRQMRSYMNINELEGDELLSRSSVELSTISLQVFHTYLNSPFGVREL